jgi:hypothetical protein
LVLLISASQLGLQAWATGAQPYLFFQVSGKLLQGRDY